ncbi:hypothetical protein BN946_scf185010.g14 [Trametes cinnabarina]|uniref:Uncharacterized protein n=1 Tax=Pycnoporus cinnabarinus TaxID=5643 RepID=A0A060SS84_PYCCI|nr:hypothetical protein BN946_scf185010.g14 [Trametes cinnabarina]
MLLGPSATTSAKSASSADITKLLTLELPYDSRYLHQSQGGRATKAYAAQIPRETIHKRAKCFWDFYFSGKRALFKLKTEQEFIDHVERRMIHVIVDCAIRTNMDK